MDIMMRRLIGEYVDNPDRPISAPLSQLLDDLVHLADTTDKQLQAQGEELSKLKAEIAGYRDRVPSEHASPKKKRKITPYEHEVEDLCQGCFEFVCTCENEPLAEPDPDFENKSKEHVVQASHRVMRPTGASKERAITV